MCRLSRCWQWIQVALLASQLPLAFPLAAQAAEAGLIDHQHHEELDDFSAPPPPPVSELAQSGLDKARSGDHLAAIKDYNRAIQRDSRDAHAYAFRSQSLRALGDDRSAQADIERVLQLRLEEWDQLLTTNPDDADAYLGRAFARLSLGDAPGAIDDYTASLQLRPGDDRTLFELGNARYRAGDKTGALNAYDQALAINPDLVEGYVARALVRLELGDVQGADADRLTARLIAPSNQVTQEREIP